MSKKNAVKSAGGGQQPAPAVDAEPETQAQPSRTRPVLKFHRGYFELETTLELECLGGALVTVVTPTEEQDQDLRKELGLKESERELPDHRGRRLYFEKYIRAWTNFVATDGTEIPFSPLARDRLADATGAWVQIMLEIREKLFSVQEDAEKN